MTPFTTVGSAHSRNSMEAFFIIASYVATVAQYILNGRVYHHLKRGW